MLEWLRYRICNLLHADARAVKSENGKWYCEECGLEINPWK